MPRSCRPSTMPLMSQRAAAGRHVLRKPDLGHTDTISITVRACRTSWNVMNPGSSAFSRSESPVSLRPVGVRQRADRHDQHKLTRPAALVVLM